MTRRWVGVAASLLLGVACRHGGSQPSQTFEPGPWLEDHKQLRDHLDAAYANLEWAVASKRVDLAVLDRQTVEAIRGARTEGEALTALQKLVAAFGDGHLRLEPRRPDETASVPRPSLTADTTAEAACDALGIKGPPAELAFDRVSGFRRVGTVPGLPAGIVSVGGGKVGVLRIPIFRVDGYRQACLDTWKTFRAKLQGICGRSCQRRFEEALGQRFLADLGAQVEALMAAHVDLLLVDIIGNGGGSDLCDPAARMLTPVQLACPRLGFVKHRHWGEQLGEMAEEIAYDLRSPVHGPAERQHLTSAAERVSALAGEVLKPCDRSGLWRGEPPACSQLVSADYYACGLFPYLTPGTLLAARSRNALFKPSGFEYREGIYAGRLAIAINSKTASAAEYFAAMLKDNTGAILIGEKSAGSGCGYTNGGIPLVLRRSGAKLLVPDCARFRKDGSNEIAGLTPDVSIPWEAADDPDVRVKKLLAALEQLLPPEPQPAEEEPPADAPAAGQPAPAPPPAQHAPPQNSKSRTEGIRE
jgi:hypothetical protein